MVRAALLLGFLVAAGCGGSGDEPGAPDAAPDDGAALDASSLTYAAFAQPFFASYCTSCHQAGGAAHDLTTYAAVAADNGAIRCGVATSEVSGCASSSLPAPRQFPIGGGPFPTDGERDQLVAWIDLGLPQ